MIDEKIFIDRYGHLSSEELRKLPPIAQYVAYDMELLKSATYTDKEISEKKEYYLSLLPLPESKKSVRFWQAMVHRYFEAKGFNKCPDKYFLMLETVRKKGTPT